MAKPEVVKKAKARSTARGARGVRAGTRAAKPGPAAARTAKARPAAAPRTAKARPAAAPTHDDAPPTHDDAPPTHDDAPPRDIPRLTRYGERFGPHKIDTRMLPQLLPIGSNALAIFDPAAPRSWSVLDRPVGGGNSRVMLSVARRADGSPGERAAALVVYAGHAQIARWTVASPPRCAVTSGWLAVVEAGDGPPGALEVPPPAAGVAPVELPLPDGRRAIAVPCGKGEYAAYWAVDAADKAVCLVVDFDVFTQKEWKAKPA